MLKGRMPRRWPMMSREDSSVLELSIYSEASSCSSGDDDEDFDDDLASEWSEWEDPLWVKDDNLRRPAARGDAAKAKAPKVRSPLTARRGAEAAGSSSGLRRSSGMGGGGSELIVRKLSALAIAKVVVPAPMTTTPTAKSDHHGSISLSISLSSEGQESGAGSPLSTPFTSSASTPTTSSRLWPADASLSAAHMRAPRKVTELVAQDEADDAWSLDGRGSGSSGATSLTFKSVSLGDKHVDQDNHQEYVAWQQAFGGHHADDEGNDGVDDGSVEEEAEAELSSDEGGTDDDDDDQKGEGDDDDDEVVEEKGIEYLLKKYFPESLAAIAHEPETRKKKKSSHKKKQTKSERTLGCGLGDDAVQPSAERRLECSVNGVALERRDKYQSLFIPSLDLRGSADADAESDSDSDVDTRRKPGSAGEGRRRRVRHRSERERDMPQSARDGFGRKSARELGMIFRCRSREDATDDEAESAVASPRSARRARSRAPESVTPAGEAQPRAKHSWVIKREDGHQKRPSPPNGNTERERVDQVYSRLSKSTSSFALAADSPSSSSVLFGSAVLSPRKKTGSFRALLSGRRPTGSSTGAAELRRDGISVDHPTLASSSSLSSSPSPSASSSTTSSATAMRRGRSSSLNKAAGLFKRSGSPRKTRADDIGGGGGAVESEDCRSGSAGGDQQAQRKEKVVAGGIKKSWREVKSYFSSDRELKTSFNGSASMPATLES